MSMQAHHAADWDHVRAIQQGSAQSFEHIYRQYAKPVYGYLMKLTRDWSIAQDLTSETFLRALSSVHSVQYRGRPLRAWLMTIARNLAVDHYNSYGYRKVVPVNDELLASCSPLTDGPEEAILEEEALAVRRDLLRKVRDCFAELPDPQRDCLTLRFFSGLSVAETARSMSRSSEAVRAIQYRAVRNLSARLADQNVAA